MLMKWYKYLLFLGIRIIVLMVIIYAILFGTNKLLYFKHTKQNATWNYDFETVKINHMISDKYYSYGDEYFPILLNRDSELPAKGNKKRILVIGDSFVWGYANTNVNRLYYKRLYQLFKEDGYNDIEIIAAGQYGYSTEDEYNHIINNDKLMKTIDPDLVIITYVPNDPEPHDKDGNNIIYEYPPEKIKEGNFFQKQFTDLYSELGDRLIYNMTNDNDFLTFIGKYFWYRWDVYREVITSGKNLEQYREIVNKVDTKLKELDIPYFYYFEDSVLEFNSINSKATQTIVNLWQDNNIPFYYHLLECKKYLNDLYVKNKIDSLNTGINPGDSHPNDVLTTYFGYDVYNILKEDYSFIFPEKKEINLPLKINDTFPKMELEENNNKYSFTYPKISGKQTVDSNYLYFPLNKDYVKLNLEFPKYVRKIKVESDGGEIELYLNTIDKKTDLDLNAINLEFYKPKKISKDTYRVYKEVSRLVLSLIKVLAVKYQ